MRPGPIDIAACPRCGALIKIRTTLLDPTPGKRLALRTRLRELAGRGHAGVAELSEP